jgi:hypothetical protein
MVLADELTENDNKCPKKLLVMNLDKKYEASFLFFDCSDTL